MASKTHNKFLKIKIIKEKIVNNKQNFIKV